MSQLYPNKAIIYVALTRPAMIWGVSIEYLFVCLVVTLSVVILTDQLSFALIGVACYGIGRAIFYWDHHLMAILLRCASQPRSPLNRQLGQVYYDVA